jgi:hypothetical protein
MIFRPIKIVNKRKVLKVYDGLNYFKYLTSAEGLESIIRIKKYRNIFQGKRCVIIGNGPSLNNMNLQFLKNEFTFGLNRIYLMFDKLSFTTTFLVSFNKHVIEQSKDDFMKLKIPKFFSYYSKDLISFDKYTVYLNDLKLDHFSKKLTYGVWQGSTVTFVAMQIAYYMGFKDIILIGIDHSFKTKGPAHKLVVSKGSDPNHFDPNYFGKGFAWQLPDLETSEIAYRMAKELFESEGRNIIDCTLGGKLKIFKKVSYEKLFGL